MIKGGSEDVVVLVAARGGDMVGGEAVTVAMMTDKMDKKSGRQRWQMTKEGLVIDERRGEGRGGRVLNQGARVQEDRAEEGG